MYAARLFFLAFWIAFLAPCFCAAQLEPDNGEEAGNPSVAGKPKTILEARSLARSLAISVQKNKSVQLRGVVIRGPLDLSYATINEPISFIGCEFEEPADFSHATFKRNLVLQDSTFRKGLDFEDATIELDGRFNGLKVSGPANFKHLTVRGNFSMENARFDFKETASLASSKKTVSFASAQFGRSADFSGTVFAVEAQMNAMEVGRDLFLEHVHFEKTASLGTTKIGGSLFLESAQFDGQASFPGIHTAYSIKAPGATFRSHVNFDEIQVDSFLNLSGSKFEWSKTPVHFVRAHVTGEATFDDVRFGGGAQFLSAHVNSDASFENTVFEGPAQFDRAHFDGMTRFEKCAFRKDATFYQTSFGSLEFAETGTVKITDEATSVVATQDQFLGSLDLRGTTYRRIQIDWQSALTMPDGTPRLFGNDRQAYTDLEKFYRDSGDDTAADGVLLAWHRFNRQKMFRTSKAAWLYDFIPWCLTDYGVAPYRMLYFGAAPLLLVGIAIFSLPGAVADGPRKKRRADSTVAAAPAKLSHWEAFAFSVHEFLPLDFPFGSQWTPGSEPVTLRLGYGRHVVRLLTIKPSTWATVLKIGGYVVGFIAAPIQALISSGILPGK